MRVKGSDNDGYTVEDNIITSTDVLPNINNNLESMLEVEVKN